MRHPAMILLVCVVGCVGPLSLPMVVRLDAEDQRAVDQSWLNMLSPPERLDRSRLLDVLISRSFHQQGVDRLNFTSEKEVWGGRVLMTVSYDRAHPAFDSFTIVFTDAQGHERRRERYTFEEVRGQAGGLFKPAPEPSTQPATSPAEIEQQRKAEREMADWLARQILIKLATRPAGEPVEESEVMPP